ncbi:hypothetical protein B9Z55_001244 [Caenorhabditis nigoni]|uniref:Uncharacterized protein n=1 Tax=Caenorhabditis nigoni TaxID=1611254 RepID=A0A2G5VER7_9PELO|nr:hypothetical protein B9Z55_001244 [Caenorhabditis nigoni]
MERNRLKGASWLQGQATLRPSRISRCRPQMSWIDGMEEGSHRQLQRQLHEFWNFRENLRSVGCRGSSNLEMPTLLGTGCLLSGCLSDLLDVYFAGWTTS